MSIHSVSALLKFSHLWLIISKLPAKFLPFKILFLSLLSAASFVEAQPGESHGNPHAIRWVDCARHVPESTAPTGGSFNSSTVDLRKLPSTLHCGQIDVPMDYSKPFCDNNQTMEVVISPPRNYQRIPEYRQSSTSAELNARHGIYAGNGAWPN